MSISPELAEQIFAEGFILNKKKMSLSVEKIVEKPSEGFMIGDLYLTESYLMFLCKDPMVDTKGSGEKAARIAVGIATLGWSQVVTGQIDKRRRNKLETKLNHPYSFAIPLKDIIRFERKQSGRLSRGNKNKNHIRLDFMGTEEIPIYILKDSLDKWANAFEQVQHLFSESQEHVVRSDEIPTPDYYIDESVPTVDSLEKLKIQLAKGEITPDEFKQRQNFIIDDNIRCENCGIISDGKFCKNCGTKLK